MKLEKLNPWNWFKHEDDQHNVAENIPIKRDGSAAIRTNSPFDSFMQLHREMDRLFDDAFCSFGASTLNHRGDHIFEPLKTFNSTFKPSTDVSEQEGQYQITVDIPGMNEDDISIEVKDRVLTIKGEKETSVENDDRTFYRVERQYGSFQRTLALPDDALADDISASLKEGVLTLSVPRKASPNSEVKRIPIAS